MHVASLVLRAASFYLILFMCQHDISFLAVQVSHMRPDLAAAVTQELLQEAQVCVHLLAAPSLLPQPCVLAVQGCSLCRRHLSSTTRGLRHHHH